MSDVNEEIVKIYFEEKGFLVRTNLHYTYNGGRSDIDLVIANMCQLQKRSLPFVLTNDDIKDIDKAAIEVKGWHTETIAPTTNNFNRLGFICRKEAVDAVQTILGTRDFKKILVIPALSLERESETIEILSEFGIDHIIEFKTIMDSLYASVNTRKNYDSEILQTIRLMKIYGL